MNNLFFYGYILGWIAAITAYLYIVFKDWNKKQPLCPNCCSHMYKMDKPMVKDDSYYMWECNKCGAIK